MLLIIVPLLIYLRKSDKSQFSKYVYGGALTGLFSSILIGTLIFNQVKALEFAVAGIFSGSLMFFLAALILYNIVAINKQRTQLNLNNPDATNVSITTFNLFMLAFITIFRESLEITLFTLPYFTGSGINIVIGILLGVLASIIMMYIVYRTSLKLSINIIFNLITIVLIFLGALMFGEGLAEFFPDLGDNIQTAGMFIYGIPTLLIFLKKTLKSLINK